MGWQGGGAKAKVRPALELEKKLRTRTLKYHILASSLS